MFTPFGYICLNIKQLRGKFKSSQGLGNDMKQWISLDRSNVFTTVILPIGVRIFLLHLVIFAWISSSLGSKFRLLHFSKPTDKINPKILKFETSHLNFRLPNFSLQCFDFKQSGINQCLLSVLRYYQIFLKCWVLLLGRGEFHPKIKWCCWQTVSA